jgi:hypothetical protein
VVTLASYLLAVVTLTHHSTPITAATATSARAIRHPAVQSPYHPIQFGSSVFSRPAACQATVLTVTDTTAPVNWIVAARASSRSRTCATAAPRPRRRCGTGPETSAEPLPAAGGGSMK